MKLRTDPMRILFVSPAPRAGTVQYTHNLASHLARRGHRVTLLTGVGYELRPYVHGYTVIEAIDRFRPRPMRLLRLWRHLSELQPQFIHYQGGQHPDMLLLLDTMLRLRGSAHGLYTPHELHSNTRRPPHDRAARKLMRRMSHIFFNSDGNRAFARDQWRLDVTRSSVTLVPDLLDFMRHDVKPEIPPVPQDRLLVLCFGLIEPRKGIGTLLEAFAQVRQQLPSAHLAVVGKPMMDLAPLREIIARHGMAAHVDLVAEYVSFERMAGYFERAQVVVLPYEAGWNSGVIPVAYGFRKPVVATTIASASEVISESRTGLLVPPGSRDALAAALLRLLTDRELRIGMQPHLEQAAIDHGWKSLVDETESVYRRLLAA